MTNQPPRTRAQKPKSAAQRASEANTIMQHAVRTNTSRPNDRRPDQKPGVANHMMGLPPGWTGKG